MWRHPQVPCITIHNGLRVGRVAMHLSINTVTDPQKVGSDTDRGILTLLHGGNLGHSSHEDGTVDAARDQQGVDTGVHIDVRLFTALN
jgi:hypothetical protein